MEEQDASSWISRLRTWSQELYLVCIADICLPSSLRLSELPPTVVGLLQKVCKSECDPDQVLQGIVREYTRFEPDQNAPPSLRNHSTRERVSVKLDHKDYGKAQGRLKNRLAEALLLDLDILQDEVLRQLVIARGKEPGGGIESMVRILGPDLTGLEWARFRAVELAAVRNCLTHYRRSWHQSQINRLRNLNQGYELPNAGDAVVVQIPHLFAYKSAVRNLLSKCAKAVKPPARIRLSRAKLAG